MFKSIISLSSRMSYGINYGTIDGKIVKDVLKSLNKNNVKYNNDWKSKQVMFINKHGLNKWLNTPSARTYKI